MENKRKLFKLNSNKNEIIIENQKSLELKKISLINPSDIEFNTVFLWILESINEFNDYENFKVDEVDISDFDIKDNASPPLHRELLISFKDMFESEIKNIFSKIENLKEK